ncbi:MAG: DegT/DnrJ/EryC1/StrS family aminotransferase [Candidatus Ancaeobacter aquaticus]|nr:DegT/DnrJ/EryC1/StrS family aminotransferase [Candidatus Ancaeobacter aquaticus]
MDKRKVEFYKHNIDEADIKRFDEVLRSIFLTTGKVVAEFEEAFSNYLGGGDVIGVTSCTAALQLCLLAWGIGHGDEVITTPMTFCATSNAVLHVGAKPVFVDVEEDTGNINADLIEEKITNKTKAIIPVHLYGQMCDMKKIKEIADKHGLIVIEDAAHCVEGVRDGIKPGQLGDGACFSFYATKNITCGEGGAIIVHDPEKAELIRIMRLHGIDKSAADRYTKSYSHWDMSVLGWKYNMNNIQAALLVGQLKKIDSLRDRRECIAKMYDDAFKDTNIRLMMTKENCKNAFHLYTIQVSEEKRDTVLSGLQDKHVGCAVNYRAVHLLKYYRDKLGYTEGMYPIAEQIGSRTITIPLYPKLKNDEVEYVVKSIIEVLNI